MNYQKLYDQLIQKRRDYPIFRKDGYCEEHHIIPRCLNGSDEKENLVNLLPEEQLMLIVYIINFIFRKFSTQGITFKIVKDNEGLPLREGWK